jgi:hypothetical protein
LAGSFEPVTIAIDSTGISVHKAGGWVKRKHGKKRRYVKLHFAVNVETHEVVSIQVSTDDEHDVKALLELVEGAGRYFDYSGISLVSYRGRFVDQGGKKELIGIH